MVEKYPWNEVGDALLQSLSSSWSAGLTIEEADSRLTKYGPNKLQTHVARSWLAIFFSQFKSLLVLLLAVASGLAFLFHDWIEGLAICAVLVLNAVIGFFTELNAVRTMDSLRKYNKSFVRVRRGGGVKVVSAEEIVPGDVILAEGGDLIAADMRILSCSRLQADESALTGESFPVDKQCGVLPNDTMLAERTNMLYKGTSLTRGSCEAIVMTTGMMTELGEISALVISTEDEETPLEKRLARLSRKLVVVTVVIALSILITGLMRGRDLYLMIETSIALAVAAIPEGLPIIATLALARGMWRMARSNALINNLSAVETLGATNVICTDKTGTLTENKMVVASIVTKQGLDDLAGDQKGLESTAEVLRVASLCNNAQWTGLEGGEDSELIGSPMETSLLVAARGCGLDQNELKRRFHRVREEAFDSESKMMATYHRDGDQFLIAVKGAAEPLLSACQTVYTGQQFQPMFEEERQWWLDKNNALALDGFRVLAFAQKYARQEGVEPYENLEFLGLACVIDPPRKDIPAAIASCRNAGIRVVMITGDQAGTALHVAKDVGIYDEVATRVVTGKQIDTCQKAGQMEDLLDVKVFARVSPQHKLDIIQMHQDDGSVVAMTGDGVNDAPALKRADIGVAMGIRGTEVARESADMVLRDDSFTSIVAAVAQGRVIFNNIRKFVVYLLSCNLSEVMVIGIASAMDAPLPLLPLQILFLNMVTDVFPALALGVCHGHEDVMARPPRSVRDPIVGKRQWWVIMLYSILITVVVLGSFTIARGSMGMSTEEAVTVSFLVIALAQILHVFNMAEPGSHPFKNEITKNGYVWAAVVLCGLILYFALSLPPLARVLALQAPSAGGFVLIVISSAIPLIVGRVVSMIKR